VSEEVFGMATSFGIEILTREKTALQDDVTEVIAPGTEGYLGVWAGHAPLITALGVGQVHLTLADGSKAVLAVAGGFMEVLPEKTVILAESAEAPQEIDRARAEAALRRAQERLEEGAFPEIDSDRARKALARALNRLKLLEESRGASPTGRAVVDSSSSAV
jgi:F-type H+-transporting ATPase subunit epsilon